MTYEEAQKKLSIAKQHVTDVELAYAKNKIDSVESDADKNIFTLVNDMIDIENHITWVMSRLEEKHNK